MKKLFCIFITFLLIVSCNSEEEGTVKQHRFGIKWGSFKDYFSRNNP